MSGSAAKLPGKGTTTRTSAGKGILSGVHTPAIVVVVLFTGWAVYSELERDIPAKEEHNHPVTDAGHSDDPEIDRLQKVVDENPADDKSLLRLANLLQDHSSHERSYLVRAITSYQKYLGRNPGDENARVDLGICYFEMSRTDTVHGTVLVDRAISEITTVATANPRHQAAAFNLGIITLNVGKTDEAEGWLRRTVAINSTSELGTRAQRLLEQHAF
jgi:tetratricopeptide (TPR) repeat protein